MNKRARHGAAREAAIAPANRHDDGTGLVCAALLLALVVLLGRIAIAW